MSLTASGAPGIKELEAEILRAHASRPADIQVGGNRSIVKMLHQGLAIEVSQYVLVYMMNHDLTVNRHSLRSMLSNDSQIRVEIIDGARKRLRERVNHWLPWRTAVYVTTCQVELVTPTDATLVDAHHILLDFPSSIKDPVLLHPRCAARLGHLQAVEHRLRCAAAEDLIRVLRRAISIHGFFVAHDTNASSRALTRSKNSQATALQEASAALPPRIRLSHLSRWTVLSTHITPIGRHWNVYIPSIQLRTRFRRVSHNFSRTTVVVRHSKAQSEGNRHRKYHGFGELLRPRRVSRMMVLWIGFEKVC